MPKYTNETEILRRLIDGLYRRHVIEAAESLTIDAAITTAADAEFNSGRSHERSLR